MVDRIEGCRDVEAHQCDDVAFIDVADDVIQYLVRSRLCRVSLSLGRLQVTEIWRSDDDWFESGLC